MSIIWNSYLLTELWMDLGLQLSLIRSNHNINHRISQFVNFNKVWNSITNFFQRFPFFNYCCLNLQPFFLLFWYVSCQRVVFSRKCYPNLIWKPHHRTKIVHSITYIKYPIIVRSKAVCHYYVKKNRPAYKKTL